MKCAAIAFMLILCSISTGASGCSSSFADEKPVSTAMIRATVTVGPSGLPLVHARIGDYDGTFVVDTGAASSVIDTALARRIGVAERRPLTWVRAQGAIRPRRMYRLTQELYLDGVPIPDIRWVPNDFASIEVWGGYDGILGRDVLHHLVLVLEGPTGEGLLLDRASFASASAELTDGLTRVPLSPDARVDVGVDGRDYRFLADTGATGAVVVYRYAQNMLVLGRSAFYTSNLFGRSRSGMVAIVPEVTIGPVQLQEVAVVRNRDLLPFRRRDGLLTMEMFLTGTFLFDIAGGNLWFAFAPDAEFDRFRNAVFSSALYYSGRTAESSERFRFVVTDVHPQNPLSFEVGVEPDDEVVTVDDTPIVDTEVDGFLDMAAVHRLVVGEFDALQIVRDGVEMNLNRARSE
jgi:predicted aspartyl protease